MITIRVSQQLDYLIHFAWKSWGLLCAIQPNNERDLNNFCEDEASLTLTGVASFGRKCGIENEKRNKNNHSESEE